MSLILRITHGTRTMEYPLSETRPLLLEWPTYTSVRRIEVFQPGYERPRVTTNEELWR